MNDERGMAEEKLGDWEAVVDDEGRTYWWNVETDETTWDKPELPVAKSRAAASFLSTAGSSCSSVATSSSDKAMAVSTPGGVSALVGNFGKGTSLEDASPQSDSSPSSLEGRSKALSVDALRKYREAKAIQAAEEEKRERRLSKEKSDKPPMIDLFK